jgi:hypothetical protein
MSWRARLHPVPEFSKLPSNTRGVDLTWTSTSPMGKASTVAPMYSEALAAVTRPVVPNQVETMGTKVTRKGGTGTTGRDVHAPGDGQVSSCPGRSPRIPSGSSSTWSSIPWRTREPSRCRFHDRPA